MKMTVRLLTIVFVLIIIKSLKASSNVNITSSDSKILFSKFGKLIPEINFATIKIKLDLKATATENGRICKTAETLKTQLKGKIEKCQINPNATWNNCPRSTIVSTLPMTETEWKRIPWKNSFKNKLISAFIDELNGICTENHRKITEIANTFHLTSTNLNQDDSNHDSNREKRQIVTAIIASVVTSLVSTFTGNQLFGMTQTQNNENAIIDNQDHIITCLEDHESRLTRNEEEIKRLQDHLSKIDEYLTDGVTQNTILTETNLAINVARDFNRHISDVQRGLYSLLKNKLDPALLPFTTMEQALKRASSAALAKGFTTAIENVVDVYQIESNFVSDGKNIYILTHVPLLKSEKIVDLYRYVATPLLLSNTSEQLAIFPENDVIGINYDRTLYNSFSEATFARCDKLHEFFWCKNKQVLKRITSPSCTSSLFLKKLDDINKMCRLKPIEPTEFVYQIDEKRFIHILQRPQNCSYHASPRMQQS